MSFSWYSLNILLYNPAKVDTIRKDEDVIFNGYFVVNNSNALVVAVYETIRGKTDTSKNLLIPTGSVGVEYGEYLGFTIFDDNTFAVYDNAYLNGWTQFDNYGLIINGMSSYPQYNRFNLCSAYLGEETMTTVGTLLITDQANNQISFSTSFEISQLVSPPEFSLNTGSRSWYIVSVSSADNGRLLFTGYIWVNELNRVDGLFEIVNGIPNFRNNLIVREAPGSSWWGKTDTGFNIMRQPTLYRYDNAYVGSWKQFDGYGIIFRGMSSFPQYNVFNFYANDFGQETLTNVGTLMIVDSNINRTFLNVVFNISPISNPIDALVSINNKRGKIPNNPNSQGKRIMTSMCGQSTSCPLYENYLMGLGHT